MVQMWYMHELNFPLGDVQWVSEVNLIARRRCTYLSEVQIKRLQNVSEARNLSTSELIRRAVDQFLEVEEKRKGKPESVDTDFLSFRLGLDLTDSVDSSKGFFLKASRGESRSLYRISNSNPQMVGPLEIMLAHYYV